MNFVNWNMSRTTLVSNCVLILWIFIIEIVCAFEEDNYKHFSLGNPALCSPITRRNVKWDAVIVDEGRFISQHTIPWNVDNVCEFKVHSTYSKGGVIAVIQNLNFRMNENGSCMDYIEFHAKSSPIQRYCGVFEANSIMTLFNSPSLYNPYNISHKNVMVAIDDTLEVKIVIDKAPLGADQRTEMSVIFTSYIECSKASKYYSLSPCDDNEKFCIRSSYFNDGHINCPIYGCIDELGCTVAYISKESVGDKVIIGSLSTLALLFTVFIVVIWAFKKFKLFCWTDGFAHPADSLARNNNILKVLQEE